MIIYVVIDIYNTYEHGSVIHMHKAFYDKEKAQEDADKRNKEDKYSWYEIEEIELEE